MTLTPEEIQALADEALDESERICSSVGGLECLDERTGRDFDRANHAATWLFNRAKRT